MDLEGHIFLSIHKQALSHLNVLIIILLLLKHRKIFFKYK